MCRRNNSKPSGNKTVARGFKDTEEVGHDEREIHPKWKQSDNPFRGMEALQDLAEGIEIY